VCVTNTGKVISKWTAGDGAKNMQTGATYGVKPIAARWNGELTGNVLRFVGDNGSAILEFALPSSNKMEGRATFKDGNGRVFLTKQ
jgi:hypothetical protein